MLQCRIFTSSFRAVLGYREFSLRYPVEYRCVVVPVQDLLRLLTLWFTHGSRADAVVAIESGLGSIGLETWLQVIPQLIARIHTQETEIKRLLHNLLASVGQRHPQALVYPLTVASKSAALPRKTAALDLMTVLRHRHGTLVDQAELVSQELIR